MKAQRKVGLPPVRQGLLLAVCLAGLAAGCASDGKEGLTAQARPHLTDVPEPNGFSLMEGRSRSYTNQAGLRWVDYMYKGRKDKFAVVRFYESQMSVSRWEPLGQQTAQGAVTLDFSKDNERCRITVSGDGGWNSTYVHVSITPNANVGPGARSGQ